MRFLIVLLVLASCACSRPPQQAPGNSSPEESRPPPSSDADVRAEFLRLTSGDAWADWPDDLTEDVNDPGRACVQVTEARREAAIALLEGQSAVELDDAQYKRLIGTARPPGGGSPYLLRAFSSANSTARVKWSGDAVVVHTDAPEGLSDVRRHPCITILRRPPSRVFTVTAYDL